MINSTSILNLRQAIGPLCYQLAEKNLWEPEILADAQVSDRAVSYFVITDTDRFNKNIDAPSSSEFSIDSIATTNQEFRRCLVAWCYL